MPTTKKICKHCGYPDHNENHHDCCPDGSAHNYSQSSLAAKIASVNRRHDNGYPLWQGPCGAGPLGGITQSMLGRFFSCRERFRLKYILGLEPYDKWNHRLGYGNMWHVCEEVLAKYNVNDNKNIDTQNVISAALSAHTKTMCSMYPMQREEIIKWSNVCWVQFPEYIKYWSQHPDVLNRIPLMQEQVFDVPYTLPSGRVVRLRGKFDSVDLIDGGIYLQENKTKGDIDKQQVERQLKFDLQTMMYLIALYEVESYDDSPIPKGHPARSSSICGVRYNVIRRPLSGGEGMIVQKKGSKNVPAETEEQYYNRLRQVIDGTGINSKGDKYTGPSHWFFRIRAEISERDIQIFKNTCLDPLLEQLCWWYEHVTATKSVDMGLERCAYFLHSMNYRTPFGIYNALEDDGATEYDAYLETGSEVGLRRIETLFPELQ